MRYRKANQINQGKCLNDQFDLGKKNVREKKKFLLIVNIHLFVISHTAYISDDPE